MWCGHFTKQSSEGFLKDGSTETKYEIERFDQAIDLSILQTTENSIFFYHSESNVLSLVTLTVLTYRIGEVFIHLSSEETQDFLETAKSKLQEEIKTLDSQSGEVKSILGNLKVKLYAKFGNNINLEAEEE